MTPERRAAIIEAIVDQEIDEFTAYSHGYSGGIDLDEVPSRETLRADIHDRDIKRFDAWLRSFPAS